MSRLIDADALIGYLHTKLFYESRDRSRVYKAIQEQPTIEPERCQLTDDDKEVIRIHLNAFKEKLCNQYRWNEAKEYEELIDRLMNLQPERKKGKWINRSLNICYPEWERYTCSECGKHSYIYDYCPNCGADMRGEK